jgi:hypothetical protein
MLYFMVTRQEPRYPQLYLAHFKDDSDAQSFIQLKIKDDYQKMRSGPIVYRVFEEEEATAKSLLGVVNENKKTFIGRHVYDYDVISKGQEMVNKPRGAKSIRFFSQGTGPSDSSKPDATEDT